MLKRWIVLYQDYILSIFELNVIKYEFVFRYNINQAFIADESHVMYQLNLWAFSWVNKNNGAISLLMSVE